MLMDTKSCVLLLLVFADGTDAFASSKEPNHGSSPPSSSSAASQSPLFRHLPKVVSSTSLRHESQLERAEKRRKEISVVVRSTDLREEWEQTQESLLKRVNTAADVAATNAKDWLAATMDWQEPSQPKQDQPPLEDHSNFNTEALRELGYPIGLCRALQRGAQIYAKRYWIIDDSLSMSSNDGHFLLYTPRNRVGDRTDKTDNNEHIIEMAPCSRWNELRETCLQHSLLALHLGVPTDFRLLNCKSGHFRIPRLLGGNHHASPTSSASPSLSDVQHAQQIMRRAKPQGTTPLTDRLNKIRREIQGSVLPKLERGQKVAIVMATDGLPTNDHDCPSQSNGDCECHLSAGASTDEAKRDFAEALQQLPPQVSVVIRLCTDDEEVLEYYSKLVSSTDNTATRMSASVQILDDYWAEADRVAVHNPWLNYGLVLHRVREMAGCDPHILPLLKQVAVRPLIYKEVAQLCACLFDWDEAEAAQTLSSWVAFQEAVDRGNAECGTVWNPIRSRLEPWVDLDRFVRVDSAAHAERAPQ